MTPIDTQTAENLLAQREWLRHLARGLVRDDSRAEDLCQETLLQALRRPLASRTSRPWLARAVRSLAARLGRDEQRRRRREGRAARREGEPSAAEVVEEVATQQLVLDAVMRLDEPYRSTILLRYWEDLPPREIARRVDAPVETVRTRLKRGLALLRERLDRECGGRKAWVMPITAFGFLGKKSLVLASGVAVVKTKTTAVAAVLLAGIALTWTTWSDASESEAAPVDEQATALRQPNGVGSAETAPAERTEVPAPAEAAADRPATAPPIAYFRGRLLNAEAVPLASVGVRLRGRAGADLEKPTSGRSDEAGVFSLARPRTVGEVVVDEAGLTTVLAGLVQPVESAEPVVVAAAALAFAGVVLGENGERLSGAQITCTLPADFGTRFDQVLDFSRPASWTARATADGSFRLPEVGKVRGARLHFSHDGYLPATLPQPDRSDEIMHVVLSKPAPVEGSLLGQVVDTAGVPVPEAKVSLGNATTVSDSDGRFTIDMQVAGKNLDIIAMKRGYLPGTCRLAKWEGKYRAAAQTLATVRLGGQPLSISGDLVDAEGRAVVGAKVWVANPTVFGDLRGGLGLISVEGYLSGGATVAELKKRFTRDGRPTMPREQILRENATAKWRWVKTDENGRFVLSGLLDRSYELSALLEETLVRVDAGPFPAGTTQARLVIPAGAIVPRVAGRVTTRSGLPVSGVRVEMSCDTLQLDRVTYRANGRRRVQGSGKTASGGWMRTGADGRFEFENVAANHVYLSLSGGKILPCSFGRPADEADSGRRSGETARGAARRTGLASLGRPIDDLLVPVSLRLHLRVELSDPDLADQLGALDAEGRRVYLSVLSPGGFDRMDRFPLNRGRSRVLSAPDTVTTLVLYKDGREVRRIPLVLQPGEVNVIRG